MYGKLSRNSKISLVKCQKYSISTIVTKKLFIHFLNFKLPYNNPPSPTALYTTAQKIGPFSIIIILRYNSTKATNQNDTRARLRADFRPFITIFIHSGR